MSLSHVHVGRCTCQGYKRRADFLWNIQTAVFLSSCSCSFSGNKSTRSDKPASFRAAFVAVRLSLPLECASQSVSNEVLIVRYGGIPGEAGQSLEHDDMLPVVNTMDLCCVCA